MNLLTITTVFTLVVNLLNPLVSGLFHKTNTTSIPQKIVCSEDLRLSQAEQKLNNKTAVDLLKKNCEWLMDNFTANLDGNNDLIFLTAGAGCASCHTQNLYVLSDNKVIFSKILDDPQVTVNPIHGMGTLTIRQTVRKDNEPMSDPSQWFEITYLWNASTKSFDKYNETTGFYTNSSLNPTISIQASTPTPDTRVQERINAINQQIDELNKDQAKILDAMKQAQCGIPCMGVFNAEYAMLNSNKAQIKQLKNEEADLELQLK